MSDETPTARKPRTSKASAKPAEPVVDAEATTAEATTADTATAETAAPAEAEVVEVVETPDETIVEDTVVEEDAAVIPATPAATVGSQPQVIYITQPAPPVRKGNRGFGVLIALASGVLFAALLAVFGALIGYVIEGEYSFDFVTRWAFYAPVLLFVVGFILLVLITNRAAWWAYILGSVFVGLFVYFGTVGVAMLGAGVIQNPGSAADMFRAQLLNPFIVVAGLLAREVSLWVGAGISRRGRRVKARNAEARAAYERDLEEKRAERERYGAPV